MSLFDFFNKPNVNYDTWINNILSAPCVKLYIKPQGVDTNYIAIRPCNTSWEWKWTTNGETINVKIMTLRVNEERCNVTMIKHQRIVVTFEGSISIIELKKFSFLLYTMKHFKQQWNDLHSKDSIVSDIYHRSVCIYWSVNKLYLHRYEKVLIEIKKFLRSMHFRI